MKTVLCYGDSNTYGYEPLSGTRYPKEQRWTTILQNRLGAEYEVVPEGLNGRTTAYDRPDFVWKNGFPYLAPCLGTNKPLDYVIFMLGTNDCNADLNLSEDDSIRKSHAIAPLYKAVAEKHGCLYLDASEILEVSEFDCEHLTVNGHAKLAGLLAEMILAEDQIKSLCN